MHLFMKTYEENNLFIVLKRLKQDFQEFKNLDNDLNAFNLYR